MEQYRYIICEEQASDLDGLLLLYAHLHEETVPAHAGYGQNEKTAFFQSLE